jgi:hypothetical protein
MSLRILLKEADKNLIRKEKVAEELNKKLQIKDKILIVIV